MIKINLLPHRERKRRQRQQQFYLALALCAIAGIVSVLLIGVVIAQQIAAKHALNQMIQSEVEKLNVEIAQISDMRVQITTLQARQQTVENLQWEQNAPVYLLEELARLTPDDVQLRSLKQTQHRVILQGRASTGEQVSEFMRNLSSQANWLEQPELIELRANTGPPGNGGKSGYDFTLAVNAKKFSAPPFHAP